jgi:AraC-like DNA-binding protein
MPRYVIILCAITVFGVCTSLVNSVTWIAALILLIFYLVVFFPFRKGFIWSYIVIGVAACLFVVQRFLFYLNPPAPSPPVQYSKLGLYFATASFLLFIIIPAVTHIRRVRAKAIQRKIENQNKLMNGGKEKNPQRHKQLYHDIVKFFEEKKPYADPDLTVGKLAFLMNTNTFYISQAIQLHEGINFTTFVNARRIKIVKDMIAEGKMQDYTIQHIYTLAGFKQQTTFNRIFKMFEGINPSDYIAQQNAKKEKVDDLEI